MRLVEIHDMEGRAILVNPDFVVAIVPEGELIVEIFFAVKAKFFDTIKVQSLITKESAESLALRLTGAEDVALPPVKEEAAAGGS